MTAPAAPSLRKVAGLALPALVVLAAEPLYVLVDTAVSGTWAYATGVLAIGGNLLTVAAWLGTVLAYGTTGRSARRYGAGDRAGAVRRRGPGILARTRHRAAHRRRDAGVRRPSRQYPRRQQRRRSRRAAGWLRIAALGAPGLLLATAGNGGCAECRTPAAHVLTSSVPTCCRRWSARSSSTGSVSA